MIIGPPKLQVRYNHTSFTHASRYVLHSAILHSMRTYISTSYET